MSVVQKVVDKAILRSQHLFPANTSNLFCESRSHPFFSLGNKFISFNVDELIGLVFSLSEMMKLVVLDLAFSLDQNTENFYPYSHQSYPIDQVL